MPDREGPAAHPCARERRARFEETLRPLLGAFYATALRLSGSEADAQDLLQEAVLLAYRHYDSFTQGTNFKAWLNRILINCYRGRYRRAENRQERVDIDDVADLHLYTCAADAGLPVGSQDAAAELLGEMDLREVAAAIDSLPDEFRLVAVLYFTQELGYQEIADSMDCPVGTVRSRLHRARKLLQKNLERLARERGLFEKVGGRPSGA